jgi:sirohydrochlorin cobaltochelatase
MALNTFPRCVAAALAMVVAAACASAAQSGPPHRESFGVLVMAHGGSPEWNQAVLDAVAPLRERYRIEVAFGMADAATIQDGLRALEARGIRNIGVLRLFVSGESWYERTEQILGLREGAPAGSAALRPRQEARDAADGDSGHQHHHHDHHQAAFFRVQTEARFALSTQGLAEAPEMGLVLADRARRLSRAPKEEEVLVLAHGPADDEENERWHAGIKARAAEIRRALPFPVVQVETLREDWPEKRAVAEQRIRALVTAASNRGRRAIVIPFRVQGFGPYAEVLDGLEYVADGRGLLPDARVTEWLSRQAAALRAGPWRAPLADSTPTQAATHGSQHAHP